MVWQADANQKLVCPWLVGPTTGILH